MSDWTILKIQLKNPPMELPSCFNEMFVWIYLLLRIDSLEIHFIQFREYQCLLRHTHDNHQNPVFGLRGLTCRHQILHV